MRQEGVGYGYKQQYFGSLSRNNIILEIQSKSGGGSNLIQVVIAELYTSFAQVTGLEKTTFSMPNIPGLSLYYTFLTDTIYLYRLDTAQDFGTVTLQAGQETYSFSGLVFTPADVGKEVPIYLDTKPPHWI